MSDKISFLFQEVGFPNFYCFQFQIQGFSLKFAVADPRFPTWGCQPQGAVTYYFGNFSPKTA